MSGRRQCWREAVQRVVRKSNRKITSLRNRLFEMQEQIKVLKTKVSEAYDGAQLKVDIAHGTNVSLCINKTISLGDTADRISLFGDEYVNMSEDETSDVDSDDALEDELNQAFDAGSGSE